MATSQNKPKKRASADYTKESAASETTEAVMRLRTLAHDLGNSLEAILQATYLLKRSKVDTDAQRWVQLIDASSQEATRINRDMRKVLRTLCDDAPTFPPGPPPRGA